MSEIKGIASKIVKVMEGIESVSKDGFNAFHKYKYVTDAAIVSEIRKVLIINKLIVIPKQISCTQTGDLTTLLVEYTLIDADSGESIVTQSYGYGQDKGDKGVYKAATGAEKYFLMKTFLLATDDDPENDSKETKSNPGRNTGVRVPAGYWKQKENDPQGAQELLGGDGYYPGKTPTGYFVFTTRTEKEDADFVNGLGKKSQEPPQTEGGSFITHEEQLEVFRQAKEKHIHHLTLKKALKDEFGVDGTAKLTKDQYPKVIEWIIRHDSAGVGQ